MPCCAFWVCSGGDDVGADIRVLSGYRYFGVLALAGIVSACSHDISPSTPSAADLRGLVEGLGAQALESALPQDEAQVALGAALFFDPILSGNRDQSCSTCHHPSLGLGDGRSLSVGTGAVIDQGVRLPGVDDSFTPRNTPALFNLGQSSLRSMFWDRRLEQTDSGEFILHDVSYEATGVVRLSLAPRFDSLLAAQVALPLLIRDEMRGDAGEVDAEGRANELATVSDEDFDGVWRLVMQRLLESDAYRGMFEAAYPSRSVEELGIEDLANALASFFVSEFTLEDSPWDRFLRGDDEALEAAARRGAALFYGEAACSGCHSGTLLTDQGLHNLGVRPMGRGPTAAGFVDLGAAHRSNVGPEGEFTFRTPPLRNVAATGPWMHNGSITTLEGVVRHHLDARQSLWAYDSTQLAYEMQEQVHHSLDVLEEVERGLDTGVETSVTLSDHEVADVVSFLEALSSPRIDELVFLIPDRVPSGLPLLDP